MGLDQASVLPALGGRGRILSAKRLITKLQPGAALPLTGIGEAAGQGIMESSGWQGKAPKVTGTWSVIRVTRSFGMALLLIYYNIGSVHQVTFYENDLPSEVICCTRCSSPK